VTFKARPICTLLETEKINREEESNMKLAKIIAVVFFVAVLPSLTPAQYTRTDLVTNSGTGGTVQDPHLVNAWGLVSTGTSPYWLSDNATGLSTLYSINNAGGGVTASTVGLVVSIPWVSGGQGSPTGIVAPETAKGVTAFVVSGINPITGVQASGNSAFIFSTLDGTISGWSPAVGGISATGASVATLAANRSNVGATYSGLAIATSNGQKYLYAADDGANRRVDVFDSNFQLADLGPDAFVDAKIPKKFAPYGIQAITDADGTETIWVTYTALDKSQGGFVDSFTPAGVLKSHFALSGPLHSPWGVALAPADFGPMSNAILVTNNTSRGRINGFDAKTGAFLGPLRDAGGKPIEIDGIWAIQFGQGGVAGSNGNTNQLFFTAGNNGYSSGIFGVITVGQ
jgi:uncharacterized protein (TIGR03118 family)